MHRSSSIIRVTAALALLALHTAAAQQAAVPLARRTAPIDTVSTDRPYGTIDGTVSDTNLAPLRGAFVSILNSRIRVGTGPNGRFRITKMPPGQFLLIVKRAGYHPTSALVDVPARDTLRLSYTLSPAPVTLDAVAVTEKAVSARMLGFETRRRAGFGEFMTEGQIAARNTVFATELFRRFTSINVSPSRTSSTTEYFPLSSREGGSLSLAACPMQVYVDQVPMPLPFNLDMLPTPRDLSGIEVYSGSSTIPPQFNGYNHGCGVILVWTKDGS